MARARISGPNVFDGSTFTGPAGGWSTPLGLDNLLNLKLISRPARCIAAGDTALSRFDVELPKKSVITGLLLEAHTLPSDALYRLTFADVADFSTVYLQTEWTRWNKRVHDSMAIEWEADNWWLGVASEELLAVYGRRLLHLLDAPTSCKFVRFEFDATTVSEFDLGYLHGFSDLSPEVNYGWGHTRGLNYRSLIDETPSGHEHVERRQIRRTHLVEFKYLTLSEQMALMDLAHRVDQDKPVVFIPNPNDSINFFRDVYLGKLTLKEVKHWEVGHHSAQLEIRRIIA